jgi:hypothetical protein
LVTIQELSIAEVYETFEHLVAANTSLGIASEINVRYRPRADTQGVD